MSSQKYISSPTSNDLLERLLAKHDHARPNHPNVGQSTRDVENFETEHPVIGRNLQRDL